MMRNVMFMLMVLLVGVCAQANLIAYYNDGTVGGAGALNELVDYPDMTASTAVWFGWGNDPTTRVEFGGAGDLPEGPTAVEAPDEANRWFFARTSRTTGSAGTPQAPRLDDNYFGFTVTADAGYVLNLNNLTFGLTSGCSGASTGAWQTDYIVFVNVDGDGFNPIGLGPDGAAGQPVSGLLEGATEQGFGLMSKEVVDLSSIMEATEVEIRVALANNRFDDGVASFVQGFQLEGAVVPEPATLGLLGLGALLLRRRK